MELDDGSQLFSTDAILKYLLANEEPVNLRDQVSASYFYFNNTATYCITNFWFFGSKWLEWCSTRLAPAIIQKNTIAHQEHAHAESVLNHLIVRLDAQLTKHNTPFLIGPKATSADYSVWSFLAQDKTTLKLPKVLDWFNRVAEQECIKVNSLQKPVIFKIFL